MAMKIRLKFSRNVKIVLLILSVVILSVIVYQTSPKPIMSWNYHGRIIHFRADLRAADKVPVYPNEDAIYLDLVHGLAKNVTIVYKYIDKPKSANAYYPLQIFQIVYNIMPAYEEVWKFKPNFNSMEVESYENLPGKIQNPIIAIVPPPYSNETAIRNEGHVTFLKAKSYEDLDLVTTKLLMIALHIDLNES